MKLYRLIKMYPGSPKLNTIFNYWTDGISEQVYNKENTPSFISLKIVKQYSEFWEEIVEKDYEILSYIHNGSKHIWKKDSQLKDTFCLEDGKSPFTRLEDVLKYPKIYLIHSVKRLSDSEIFTIGDKVRISKLQCDGSFIIDRFYFDCNNDKLLCNGKGSGNGHVSINKIERVKQPLFTTEDGINIYKGDTVYPIYIKDFSHRSPYIINTGESCLNKDFKDFSTKEKAEEYVLMNKPCLSIIDLYNLNLWSMNGIIMTKTKELVKRKIKQ